MPHPDSYPFYAASYSRETVESEVYETEQLLARLDEPWLEEQIDAGCMTLAMIRPNVGPEANMYDLPDQDAADMIETFVEGLGVAAKFSVRFTLPAVEQFYDNARERMEHVLPLDNHYGSRWPEYCDFMISGPVTVMLLHDPTGHAVEKWRDQLGHWNIDENRDSDTIRGRVGVNRYNNLVHGSDAPASVRQELDIIKGLIRVKL